MYVYLMEKMITIKATEHFIFYFSILHFTCNGFELIKDRNVGNIELMGNQNECKGHAISNINRVVCSAVCYDPTSTVWNIKGYTGVNPYPECDWFTFEGTTTSSTGSCTLCFTNSQLPVTFEFSNLMTSLVFAKNSILCEYPEMCMYLKSLATGRLS